MVADRGASRHAASLTLCIVCAVLRFARFVEPSAGRDARVSRQRRRPQRGGWGGYFFLRAASRSLFLGGAGQRARHRGWKTVDDV